LLAAETEPKGMAPRPEEEVVRTVLLLFWPDWEVVRLVEDELAP
jgi:hypothetical protein